MAERRVIDRARAPCEEAIDARPSASAPGLVETRFTKRFSEEWLFRATLRNSLRACAAARRSFWLQVPKVLRVVPAELRIDYEYLAGWTPLRTVMRDRSFDGRTEAELRRLFWTIGAALEELHRHTRRIHGDFDFDNILVKRGTDRAVFVDFTPPEYTSYREYNQADPYRDIAMFVFLVRAKYPPHAMYLALRPELTTLARAFIEGYFRGRPGEYARQTLESHMNDMLDNTYLGKSFAARFFRNSRLFRVDDLDPRA